MSHRGAPVSRPLRVMVVDDSALVRQVLTAILEHSRGVAVLAAANPVIAMRKMQVQRPDVMVLDLEMPAMDGLTFLRKLMAEDPIPVVICSEHAGHGSERALEALSLGAVAIINKPHVGVQEFLHESAVRITDAVMAAAQARVVARCLQRIDIEPRNPTDAVLPLRPKAMPTGPTERLVAIGASTGGTEALQYILEAMPEDSPGIVMVQHMPEGFTAAFARRLDQLCRVGVKEAASGDEVLRGRALLAPGDRHMLVHRSGGRYHVEIVEGPLVARHRPSVNVLFRSAAQAAGRNGIGVLLTGMGDDGAEGLYEMKQAGAVTLAQDAATCVVFGMPKAAIDRGAVDRVVGLPSIPEAIVTLSAQAGVHDPSGRRFSR